MLKKLGGLLAVLMATTAFSQDASDLKISGWGAFTFGRVESGFTQYDNSLGSLKDRDLDFSKRWLSDYMGGIRLERQFGPLSKARLHIGVLSIFQLVDNTTSGGGANLELTKRRFVPFLIDAGVDRIIEINDQSKLRLELGYLPVRYNQQAANLGEYLFRSTPYPTTIESGFEQADKEKIPGVHAEYSLTYGTNSKFKADLYTFTGMRFVPLFDISNALLVSLNHENVFELGAGICFHNMWSVDERQTTPGLNPENGIKEHMYYNVGKDTTWYTTKGTKLMVRATINPKQLFDSDPENSLFGSEDLKIYSEIAVIGLKNYPGWYENIKDRIPLMFGINLPGFKIIDLISLQLQWWGNPYYNSFENVWKSQYMDPYVGKTTNPPSYKDYLNPQDTSVHYAVHDDDWKWSLYLTKTINKRMKLSLQFANDNLMKNPYMPPPPSVSKYTEVCRHTWWVKNGKEQWGMIWNWYWMARVMFFI